MWSNELGKMPIIMPPMLKPGEPCKDSLGASSLSFSGTSLWTSQNFTGSFFLGLSVLTLFPLCSIHLFPTSSSSLCPSFLSPEAITLWVPVTPPHLLTFSSFSCYFLAAPVPLYFVHTVGAHPQSAHAYKTYSSFISLAHTKLHISSFLLFISKYGHAGVATSMFTIFSLSN